MTCSSVVSVEQMKGYGQNVLAQVIKSPSEYLFKSDNDFVQEFW
jgi:hypothetical protein